MAGQQHPYHFFPPPQGLPTQWQTFAAQAPANPYMHQPPPMPGMHPSNAYHPGGPPIPQMPPSLPGLGGFPPPNAPRFPSSSSVPPPPPPILQHQASHQPYSPFASNPALMQHRPASSHMPPNMPTPGLTPAFHPGPSAKDGAAAGAADNQNHWSAQSNQRKKPPLGPRNGASSNNNHGNKSAKNNKQKKSGDAQAQFSRAQNAPPPPPPASSLPPRPSQGQVEQQKAFIRTLVDHQYGYKELVGDALAMDPERLRQLFHEMGLSTGEQNPRPAPANILHVPRSALPGLNPTPPGPSPVPTPAQAGPVDRKEYIARLMAAKGKKGTPPQNPQDSSLAQVGANQGLSNSTAAQLPGRSPNPVDPAAKRKADLARLRAEALQSARAAKAAKEARERESQPEQQSPGEQNSETRMAYADPQSVGAPAPLSASRLPGLFMDSVWDESTPSKTGEKPKGWSMQDSSSSKPHLPNPDEIDIDDVDDESPPSGTPQRLGSAALQDAHIPTGPRSMQGGSELKLKEQKILEVKKRLQLMEARKRAKMAGQRVKTQQAALENASQGVSTPSSAQLDVSSPAAEQRGADMAAGSARTPRLLSSHGGGGVATPGYMTPQPSMSLRAAALINIDTRPGSSGRKRKREEIESDLSAHQIQSESTLSKMQQLKAQMRELEEAVQQEQERKTALVKELEELGVNTDNVPDSELQETRDHVVAVLEAEQAGAAAADETTMDSAGADAVSGGTASSASVNAAAEQDAQDVKHPAVKHPAVKHPAVKHPAVKHPAVKQEDSDMAIPQPEDEESDEESDSDSDDSMMYVFSENLEPSLYESSDDEDEDEDEDSDEDEDENEGIVQSGKQDVEVDGVGQADVDEGKDGVNGDADAEKSDDGVSEAIMRHIAQDEAAAAAAASSPADAAAAADADVDAEGEVDSGSDVYDPAPALPARDARGDAPKASVDDSYMDSSVEPADEQSASGGVAVERVVEDGAVGEIGGSAEEAAAVTNGQDEPATPAESRPPNPFASSSSESGEIYDSASPENDDDGRHSATNEDQEDYEPQEPGANADADADADMEEDDYEPPEASGGGLANTSTSTNTNTKESGMVMLDEGGNQDPFARTGAAAADDLAQELQPAQGAAPAEMTQDGFTAYRSPLHAFKDFRFHPDYAASTPGGYQSLTYSNAIDTRTPLCPVECGGETCHDPMCAFQHFGSMKLTGEQVILQLATDNPGRGEDEQRAFRRGLTAVLQEQHAQGNQDPERVSALIAAFRREFAADPARFA